jgi:hypothetical protein
MHDHSQSSCSTRTGVQGRREFLAAVGFSSIFAASSRVPRAEAKGADAMRQARFFFTSQGKTALVNADGTGLRYFNFDKPGQATWQVGATFPDGRRVIFLSMEPRRDGPGRPFEEYYTQTPTHLWVHDLESGSLEEICAKDRLAPFVTPALLLNDGRILVQVVRNKVGQIFSVRLDGTDPREFTRAGEGLPYGLSLSPDGRRVAFHLASPQGYQVWTSDTDGTNRVRVAARPGHLYFGTSWSPDGRWVLYVDCLPGEDPGHDWADVCIGRHDAAVVLEAWRQEYNADRPHSSLGYRTPREFRAAWIRGGIPNPGVTEGSPAQGP